MGHSKTKGAASDMAKSYLLFDHSGGLLVLTIISNYLCSNSSHR